ncbi:MAG: hypothetical protein APF84_03225 [Gracilibacter sp. BRH_c7a]|nr:MAG: hypothetical protein APF84_03225 [Gracilibacter sp. BRH_c7a]
MKRKFTRFCSLSLVLMLVFTFAGCSASTPAPDKDSSSTPAVAEKKVYEFSFALHEPPTSTVTAQYEAWAKIVEEKTQGQVIVKVYPSETLGKAKDAVSMVQQGIADMTWVVIPFFPGQFPITEVLSMPMLGVDSSDTGGKSLVKLYEASPEMQKEYSKFKVLTFTSSGAQFITTNNKKVSTLNDLKGLNIRVAGWGPSELLKSVGGSPISMPPPDMYEASAKGVIDGFVFDWAGIQSSKLYEVSNYALITPFAAVPHVIIMNKQKWESLPPDLQAIMDELTGEYFAELIGKGFDQDAVGVENFKKLGKEVYTLTPDEEQKWQQEAKKIWQKWVDENKTNFDSQKVLTTLQDILANK